MKKLLALAGLVGSLYAQNAVSQVIPTTVDDGRPYLARTNEGSTPFSDETANGEDWYLAFPLIPYIGVNDCTMFRDTYNLATGLLDLDMPEGNVLEDSELFEAFAADIDSLPIVNGSVSIENMIRFGTFTDDLIFHGYAGGYGRADFRSMGLDDYVIEFDLENELVWANFGRPQNVFQGMALAEIVAGGDFVIPFSIQDVNFRPSFGIGYRHREAAAAFLSSDALIYTPENVYYPELSEVRSYGDGLYINMGLAVDFREIEEYTRPVIALSVGNLFSYTHYTDNPLNMPEYDPMRVNLGFEITPMGWFNIRGDILNIGNSPEYRFEIAKIVDWGEFSAFVRIDEQTLLGNFRDSFNIMAAFGNEYGQLRLYGSVDDDFNFGIGMQLGVGWRVSEFM